MIGRRQRANARMVLLIAARRYGDQTFRVDRAGPNWRPLKDSEFLGWCSFNGEYCTITENGMTELADYDGPRAVVSFVCPVCQTTVAQAADAEGLPTSPSCPTCQEAGVQAAERFRTEQPA